MHSLTSFQNNKVNLTSIQSFPEKPINSNYSFYVELEGHANDENVKKALEELKNKSIDVKIIGSFPEKQATILKKAKPTKMLH